MNQSRARQEAAAHPRGKLQKTPDLIRAADSLTVAALILSPMPVQRDGEWCGCKWGGGEADASQKGGPLFNVHLCRTDVRNHSGYPKDRQEADNQGRQSGHQPAANGNRKSDDSPNNHEQ